MKTNIFVAVAVSLLLGSWLYAANPLKLVAGALSSDPTPSLSGDLNLDGYDIYGKAVKTTDAAPDASSIACGQSAYWGAAAGTNSTGGACYLSGGVGARKVAVVAAAIENDTLTIAGIKGGVATSAVWTYNAGGIGTCAALTNSQCAVLLVNYCNTNGPALGIASCACADASCTVATVGFLPSTDTVSLTLTASDASQTVTRGSDGDVYFGTPGATSGTGDGQLIANNLGYLKPAYSFSGDDDTGLCYVGANDVGLCANGGTTLGGSATGLYTQAVLAIYWKTRALLTSPADGYVKCSNAAANGGCANQVYPQTITCADSGGAGHSDCGGAQTIQSSIVQMVCSDADGCTLTLAETNWSATASGCVTIFGPAASHVDLADSAGVVELVGGATWTATTSTLANIKLCYAPAALAWVEASRAAP